MWLVKIKSPSRFSNLSKVTLYTDFEQCGALTYEDEDLDKDWDSLEDIVPWLKSEKRDIAFETRTGRFEVEGKQRVVFICEG